MDAWTDSDTDADGESLWYSTAVVYRRAGNDRYVCCYSRYVLLFADCVFLFSRPGHRTPPATAAQGRSAYCDEWLGLGLFRDCYWSDALSLDLITALV